jgi:rare lipoprotein A
MQRLAALAALMAIAAPAAAVPRHPVDKSGKTQTGVASYYGAHHAGKTTASGKPMRPDHLTAASPSLPLGTKAKVTNRETGKSVHVTVTDRGPYAKGRILDVSSKAAETLGMKHDGVAPVKVKPVEPPPPKR